MNVCGWRWVVQTIDLNQTMLRWSVTEVLSFEVRKASQSVLPSGQTVVHAFICMICKHVCRHVCANTFQSFKASLGLSERYIVHVRICVCPVCVLRQISDSSQPKVISFFPLFQKTMTSWRSWKRNNETISTIVCLWDVELENHTMGVISTHLQRTADPSPFPPQFSNTSSLRKVLCYGGVLKEQSPKQHWWPWQKDALTYLHLLCVLLKLS